MNARTFSINSTTQENITILRLKEDCKTYTKKKTSNQKLNLQDGLYRLGKRQTKGPKLRANIRWKLWGKKYPKNFFKVLERQNMQNQTIFELYTDDNKSKYLSNPKGIFKCTKINK